MTTKKQRAHKMTEGRKFWAQVATAIGAGAFFQQITEKDFQAAYSRPDVWAGYSAEQKIKFIAGRFINRVTGVSVFPKEAGTLNFKISPMGVFNKWTGIGIGAQIYRGLAKPLKLPHAGKVGNTGIALLFAGIVGGLLDPPDGPGPGTGFERVPTDVRPQAAGSSFWS